MAAITKTQPWRGRWVVGGLLAVWLLGGWGGAVGAQRPASDGPRYFAATNLTMAAEFTGHFDALGGLPVIGYPITEPRQEGGYLVQYFERERLEYHPEYAGTPYAILLGRLGAELTATRGAESAFLALQPPTSLPADRRYVPETGHTVGGRFAAYWDAHGGLSLFGYPISEEFTEEGTVTQWFERARFEYHPEHAGTPSEVLLGLLGRELLDVGDPSAFDVGFTVGDGPTHTRHLTLNIAQGGESRDPLFLQSVIPQGRALAPPMIRLDNIFNHYDVVERGVDGKLVYHFEKLDTAVDQVREMGATPYLCLGYMPQALAPAGNGISPPDLYDEWRELVYHTVYHLNVERGLGIKYWEVWNEPNLGNSWTGSYVDYLRLYDASRDGIVQADPNAWVGGPTITPLDPTAPAWLLEWEAAQGAKGRVDFISWHSFGHDPEKIEGHIRAVQAVVAKQTRFHPPLIISEFSVNTGGPDDTSLGSRSDSSGSGAYALACLAAMERAGLDQAFAFELKEGSKPGKTYWGRWGLLTNDGQAKPAYHALYTYQRMRTGLLPVQLQTTEGTGVDMIAAQTATGGVRLLVWHGGFVDRRIKITLPAAWAVRTYNISLFDRTHNNFAQQGNDHLTATPPRRGDQLIFDLQPDGFMIAETP